MGNATDASDTQPNIVDKPTNWTNGKCLFGGHTDQFISTGKVDGNKVLMTYNNPLQIALSYYKTDRVGRNYYYRYSGEVETPGVKYSVGDTCKIITAVAGLQEDIGLIYIDEVDNNGGIVKFHMEHLAPEINRRPGHSVVSGSINIKETAEFSLVNVYTQEGTEAKNAVLKITSESTEVEGGTIAGFRFKTHHDENYLGNFIGKFAIYGSVSISPSYNNIKNSSEWVKLTDIQEMSSDINADKWSNFFTLDTYNVNTGMWTSYNHYVIEIYSVRDNKLTVMPGCQVAIGQIKAIYGDQYSYDENHNLSYTINGSASTIQYGDNNKVKLRIPLSNVVTGYTVTNTSINNNNRGSRYSVGDSVIVPDGFTNITSKVTAIRNGYYTFSKGLDQLGNILDGGANYAVGDTLRYLATDIGETDAYFTVTSAFDGKVTGLKFKEDADLIEGGHGHFNSSIDATSISLVLDGTREGTKPVILRFLPDSYQKYVGEIKSVTPINKGFYLNAPNNPSEIITDSEFGKGGKLDLTINSANNAPAFPNDMQFYEYSATIVDATLANGYTSTDILEYVVNTYYGSYTFRATISNPNTGECLVKLIRQGDPTQYSVLRGKEPININNMPLSYVSGTSGAGTGATITITSTSTINLYANYTGNYYSDSDIQSIDIPTIEKYNHFTTYLEFKQPKSKNVNIELDVEYENNVTASEVKNKIINAVHSIFNITPYYIGKPLNVSDIWKAVNSVKGVRRFIVVSPVDNIECKPYEFITLLSNGLVINDISPYNTYNLTPRD